jgi:hypothetical protein
MMGLIALGLEPGLEQLALSSLARSIGAFEGHEEATTSRTVAEVLERSFAGRSRCHRG